MGSTSDWEVMQHCVQTLEQLGIGCERRALSAHRTPHLAIAGCSGAEAIFLGDDIQDLPGFEVCGLSFAPFDAHARVRSRATAVLGACGGAGVLREVADLVCSARRS